jgi:hypothetical protein
MIGVFVGFSRIILLGILSIKGLTTRRLYKSFDFKGLILWDNNFEKTDVSILNTGSTYTDTSTL